MRVNEAQIRCAPPIRETQSGLGETWAEEESAPLAPTRRFSGLLRNRTERRLQTQGHPRRAWDPVKCDLSQLSFPAGLRWPETQASTPPGAAAAAAAFPTPARPLALFARSWSKCSMYWSMTYMSFTGTASVSGLKPATFPKRKRSVFRSYGQKYTVKKMYEAFGSS